MIQSKEEFLKTFLPESVQEVTIAQINLDITDLSISDILRNVDKTYPHNTRRRNAMASGTFCAGILCKTETLDPMQGIFLLFTNGKLDLQLISRRYIIVCVDESKISSDQSIARSIDRITDALVTIFRDQVSNLGDFFRKFIYDPYEMEEVSDGYMLENING